MAETKMIDQVTADRQAHFEPYGWHHWPEHPWLAYQFRRGLGETQEGGGAVSECFQAASRMVPGDLESWHTEWIRVGDRNRDRGNAAEAAGHIQTARNCWLRAVDYYRNGEFFLEPDDPRRIATFDKLEGCTHKFLSYLMPAGEVVEIPYEDGSHLDAYFVRAPFDTGRQPVLICFGGLDSFKDEMWFMQAHGAVQRGISVLMVDGPGQGGTLRRQAIANRPDYEVPVGACIDWLEGRDDINPERIAACGSSLGGFYIARAGCYEPRLAGAISHGAIWSIHDLLSDADENHGLASHLKWVFGMTDMAATVERMRDFTLAGHFENMQCPYFILHGGYDVLGVAQANQVHAGALAAGVDVTFKMVGEEETGAEHCQHDNPTLGQEYIGDWLVDLFAIDERELLTKTVRAMA